MDLGDEGRLRRQLDHLPVPEHRPDYRERRERALTAAAGTAVLSPGSVDGSGSGQEARRRLAGSRKTLLIAAAIAILLAAALAIAVVALGAQGLKGPSAKSEPSSAGMGFLPSSSARGSYSLAPSSVSPAPPRLGAQAAPGLLTPADRLDGMVRGNDGSLWAWGVRYPAESSPQPLLEHWNGTQWLTVSAPDGFIDGLAALSPTDIWAMVANDHGGWLTHWDGSTW
jgi:hypothetical protein